MSPTPAYHTMDSAQNFEPPPVPPPKEKWVRDSKAKSCPICRSADFGMVCVRNNVVAKELYMYTCKHIICKHCFLHKYFVGRQKYILCIARQILCGPSHKL